MDIEDTGGDTKSTQRYVWYVASVGYKPV